MLSAAAAAGIGALGSIGNTALSSVFSNSANKKSKNAALTQFWMQNYFMNKQNEYNKPINQMKRLREAGLNPNLVYGNGADTLSAGPSGAMAKVTPVHVSDFDALRLMMAGQEIEQRDKNIERTEFDIKQTANQIWMDQKNMQLKEKLVTAQVYNLLQSGTRTKLDNDFYLMLNELFGTESGGAGVNFIKNVAMMARILQGK